MKYLYHNIFAITNSIAFSSSYLPVFIPCSKPFKKVKIFSSASFLKCPEFSFALKYKNGNVYTGIVGSADVWNREKDKLKFLSEKHQVSCEDMELIAIYTVAKNYKIPAIGIKIMSDNELLGEEYEPDVGHYVQEYTYEVLKEIIKKEIC